MTIAGTFESLSEMIRPQSGERRRQLDEGMRVLQNIREHGEQALSESAACLVPLLDALRWTGRARHLSEAIPHFVDDIDIDAFRETLANLNLKTVRIRTRQDRLMPGVLPCLFVPDRGRYGWFWSGRERGDVRYRVYDGFTRTERISTSRGISGTAYAVRPVSGNFVQRDNSTWVAELLVRFRKLVVQVLIATLMINLLSIAMPLFMMSIYDTVIPSASITQLYFLAAGVSLAIGLEWLFRRLRSAVMAHAAGRIDYPDPGTAGFQQVLMLPISMSENEPLGAQISHLQEFESVREFFAGPLGETIIDLPFSLLALSVIAMLGGWLALSRLPRRRF